MMQVNTPVENFFDVDGTALDDGYIYVGQSGLNPETHPQALFWDKDGTIPAAQPIRTRNGYPFRDGAAAKFYTATAFYSITVRNKTGALVFSSLNTDSGVFNELATSSGASNVGYNNTASEMAAENVQEAINELKTEIQVIEDDFLSSSSMVINLFGNSAFNQNRRGYVSGTPTTGENEFTLDLLSVVVSGQSLSFVAGDFGNRITAPAGGLEQIIPASIITGGSYACTWKGSGTITVNGAAREKNASFDLPANTLATIRMIGEFEQFSLTRPNTTGVYEFDFLRDLSLCRPIVESGTNSNGRYTRWADGTQICIYRDTVTRNCNEATAVTNLNMADTAGGFTFPAAFVADPEIQWSLWDQSFSLMWAIKASNPNALESGGVRAATASSNTTRTAKLAYLAIGRWF